MAKSVTLKFTNYRVTGVADVTMWGGGRACIEMTPFTVDKLDKETLLEKINDGGFGVERINGAVCDVSENFEGHLVFKESLTVGKVSEHTLEYHSEIY
jgi:hypothetical protein